MPTDPPLTGIRVLELAGLAPAPFCGLLLAHFGASVLRIDRPSGAAANDLLTSHKSSLALNLKSPRSISLFLHLLPSVDILIDPFRPGVLEKLGLDPQTVLLKTNPRLIVVRLTGFRRDGKYKDMAGHDINYLAASGALSMLGAAGKPPSPPGNILADFAGGGHVAFTGVLLALLHRGVSGKGQVVDANMVDGVAYLASFPRMLTKIPFWGGERGTNVLDGGAPYYGCYECRDKGMYMSVGALEPQFWRELLRGLGLSERECLPPGSKVEGGREDRSNWPFMRSVFENRFRERTRREWEEVFDGTDACVVPVLGNRELEESGYEMRGLVGLSESPARRVEGAYKGRELKVGEGGEDVLRDWAGWRKGREYEVGTDGAMVLVEKAKL